MDGDVDAVVFGMGRGTKKGRFVYGNVGVGRFDASVRGVLSGNDVACGCAGEAAVHVEGRAEEVGVRQVTVGVQVEAGTSSGGMAVEGVGMIWLG